MAKLLLMFGGSVLKELDIDKDVITIGRKPGNDVLIDNLAVSGFHAKIIKEAGQYFIEDLNSTNGTFLAQKRVSRSALKNNDVITIGKHTLKFLSGEPETDESADATVRIKPQSLNDTVILSNKQQPKVSGKAEDIIPAATGKTGVLTVISGATDKKEYELKEKLITIGKANSAGIRLKGLFAPSVAALINKVRDEYFINSPGSGKKPLVNDKPVQGKQMLCEGDVVDVGGVKMHFTIKEV